MRAARRTTTSKHPTIKNADTVVIRLGQVFYQRTPITGPFRHPIRHDQHVVLLTSPLRRPQERTDVCCTLKSTGAVTGQIAIGLIAAFIKLRQSIKGKPINTCDQISAVLNAS